MTVHPEKAPDRIRDFIRNMKYGYELLSEDPRFKGNKTNMEFVREKYDKHSGEIISFTACVTTCANTGLYRYSVEHVLKNKGKIPEIITLISEIYIPVRIIMDNLPEDYRSVGQINGGTNATFRMCPEIVKEFFEPNSYLMVQHHSENYWYSTMDNLVYYLNDQLHFDIHQISDVLSGIADDIAEYNKYSDNDIISVEQIGAIMLWVNFIHEDNTEQRIETGSVNVNTAWIDEGASNYITIVQIRVNLNPLKHIYKIELRYDNVIGTAICYAEWEKPLRVLETNVTKVTDEGYEPIWQSKQKRGY